MTDVVLTPFNKTLHGNIPFAFCFVGLAGPLGSTSFVAERGRSTPASWRGARGGLAGRSDPDALLR